MRRALALGLVVLCAGSLAYAVDTGAATQQLQAMYPNAGLLVEHGQLTRVYGAILGVGQTAEEAADGFVQAHSEVFGVPAEDMLPGRATTGQYTQPMGYDARTGQFRFTLVYYRQSRDGVPVCDSDLRVLTLNDADHPVVLAASSLRNIAEYRVPAGATRGPAETQATQAALKLVPSLTAFGPSELVIFAGVNQEQLPARLALVFVADNYAADNGRPERWRFVADAETGEILHRQSLIVFTDVTGSVQGMATTGSKADICNPEVATPMPWARVQITGGSAVNADGNGNFVIPNGGTASVTVQSFMYGTYFTVDNYVGAEETLSLSVAPPGPANFMHNQANTAEFVRAQVNAYVSANKVRDWVLAQNPAFPTISTETGFPIYVNRSDLYCPGNAWSDGSSINFCAAGSDGTYNYPNTAWQSVLNHEYGHHVVDCGGSGQDEYGEGIADCHSVLPVDDPILGYGFFGNCSSGLRTAANNCQYSASNCSSCGSEVHDCGQLLAGAVWSVRDQLVVTEPVQYLSILSQITVDSILLHNGTSITPQICIDFLTLDDTDGDLTNGTPHFSEITAGFAAHGLWTGLPVNNDLCPEAPPACPGTYTGTTSGKTRDGSASCASGTAPDAWYSYTPTSSGTLSLNLCDSGYDTVLSVHTGCPGTTSNQIACNDDTGWFGACGWFPTDQSALTVSVTANQTYYIRISGAGTAAGDYVLAVSGPACAPSNYSLTVNTTGQGSVTLNPPGGVYSSGTTVTLTANGATGWHFDHWEGALSGSTNPTTLLMNGNKTVTAVFAPNQYTLTVNTSGQGTVALDPPGGVYSSGTSVTLTANGATGWHFDHWEGALSGSTNPTTLLMNGNKTVTAAFAPNQYTLTVSTSGQGSVVLDPPGGSYSFGTTVQLSADADAHWQFDHWEGALTGSTNPASLLMDGNKSVTAAFLPLVCRGDCNCDGEVGFADIDLFVAAIPDNQTNWATKYQLYYGTTPPAGCWENCDVNGVGTHAGFDDIDPFVAKIPSACP